jgi:hypothetical protein
MWTKIEKTLFGKRGRPQKLKPTISRFGKENRFQVRLNIPAGMATAGRVDFYCDGRRLGMRFNEAGIYTVFGKPPSLQRFLTVPSAHVDRIPFGTRECDLTEEDGYLVLDLAQFDDVTQET